MLRKIKNTTPGGLGTYIGSATLADGKTPTEREHIVFAGGSLTEVDEKKLAEAVKDPIVKSWFDEGLLVDQTVPVGTVVAAKADEDKGAKK